MIINYFSDDKSSGCALQFKLPAHMLMCEYFLSANDAGLRSASLENNLLGHNSEMASWISNKHSVRSYTSSGVAAQIF